MGDDVRPFHGVADIAEQRTTFALRQQQTRYAFVYLSVTKPLTVLSRFALQAEPMILTVGNVKGGVGKTTLALNIAISRALAGRDVLLVAGDEQGTPVAFTDLRAGALGAPGYTAVILQGAALRTQVRQLAPKYDDVVIDVGGRDTGSLRAALTVADTLLIPVQRRTFDVWSVEQMAELVREAWAVNERLRALAVLNAADSAGRENDEATAAVAETDGIACLDVRVVRRRAFPNAAAAGRSVVEQAGQDPKAAAELTALVAVLYDGACISG
jgi:chromosome partitioning protein